MASPVDTFKNSLFGQLKSYSNAVQVFLNNVLARPLLAFKRDLSRPTSETRRSINDEAVISSYRTREESTSSSSPLEIIDIDTSGSIKSIFDKVKNTLSPSTKRRTSENPANDESKSSSASVLTNKDSRKQRLNNHKSVSFAENVDNDQYSIDDQNEIVRNAHTLANQILSAGIGEVVGKTNILSKTEDDFERDFHQTIKSRRISTDNMEDLIYQDLSAEIVAYVLKHAIRTLKKEQDDGLLSAENQRIPNHNEQDDDFIDLK